MQIEKAPRSTVQCWAVTIFSPLLWLFQTRIESPIFQPALQTLRTEKTWVRIAFCNGPVVGAVIQPPVRGPRRKGQRQHSESKEGLDYSTQHALCIYTILFSKNCLLVAHSTNTFLAPHCEEEYAGQHLERFQTQIELHMLRNHSFTTAPDFEIGETGARIPFHEGLQHVCTQLIMLNAYKHRCSSRCWVTSIHPRSILR